MITTTGRWTALLATISLISACGGGGGSGSGGTNFIPFTSFGDTPENGTVELQGDARTASYAFDPATGQIALSNVSTGAEDSTLEITYEDGDVAAVRLLAPGSQVAFDLRSDSTIDVSSAPAVIFESDDGERFAIFIVGGANGAFQYQTVASWLSGYASGSGTLGAGAHGARTPDAGLPVGAIATYRGEASGFATDPDGYGYSTVSFIEINTDFNDLDISSTGTMVIDLLDGGVYSVSGLDFAGSGTVSGATFTAPVSGTLTSGQAEGAFHGPNAEEVAGTYSLSGPDGVRHIGAFGAN